MSHPLHSGPPQRLRSQGPPPTPQPLPTRATSAPAPSADRETTISGHERDKPPHMDASHTEPHISLQEHVTALTHHTFTAGQTQGILDELRSLRADLESMATERNELRNTLQAERLRATIQYSPTRTPVQPQPGRATTFAPPVHSTPQPGRPFAAPVANLFHAAPHQNSFVNSTFAEFRTPYPSAGGGLTTQTIRQPPHDGRTIWLPVANSYPPHNSSPAPGYVPART